jgi:hypothetical protein
VVGAEDVLRDQRRPELVLDVGEGVPQPVPVDAVLASARVHDVRERLLLEPAAPEVPELVDSEWGGRSRVVGREGHVARVARDDPGESDAVHRRPPEACRDVRHVADVEAVREHLAQQRRPGAGRTRDEDEWILDRALSVQRHLQRLEGVVHAREEVLVRRVLRVRAPSVRELDEWLIESHDWIALAKHRRRERGVASAAQPERSGGCRASGIEPRESGRGYHIEGS